MRIALFDTILERHVELSLRRALVQLGHEVVATEQVWQGWEFPAAAQDRDRLARVVDSVIQSTPDAMMTMRISALRPEQVTRFADNGIRTVAWLPDDPVFFEAQSRIVAGLYDITLHTAGTRVLKLYEDELGVRGWQFPFWTDSESFPHLYDPARCDLDLVFIGNTHNAVRAWRYDWIADLPLTRAIYGLVANDPARIWAGRAPDEKSLARAAARGRVGLNIGQRFSDYSGSAFDFPGLAHLGEFTLSSRIVQLAAVGLPIVSFVRDDETAASLSLHFPPVVAARDKGETIAAVRSLIGSTETLEDRSRMTHSWFLRHYTADSRARFLISLLQGREHDFGVEHRATAYLGHPSSTPLAQRTS